MKNVGRFVYLPNSYSWIKSKLMEQWLDTSCIVSMSICESHIDQEGRIEPKQLSILCENFKKEHSYNIYVLIKSDENLEEILDNIHKAMEWERNNQ